MSVRSTLMLLGLSLSAPPLAGQQVGPVGANQGYYFDDRCDVSAITVRSGWWVDGVQVHCRNQGDHPHRGGAGGGSNTFLLESGERIISVQGIWNGPAGPYIYAIQFITDRRASPLFGNGGPPEGQGYEPFRLDVPQGSALTGLHGWSGEFLGAIGITYGAASTSAMAPTPVYPLTGQVADNGCSNHQEALEHDFEWTPVPGASHYHLRVERSGAQNPAVDQGGLTSNVYRQSTTSYVASHLIDGWSWTVSAYVNGQWSPWSPNQYFSYEPPDSDCGGPPRPGPQRYQIGVQTGTVSGAGTDANVMIKLRGTNGESGWIPMSGYLSGNPFENGDANLFFLDFDPGLGEITQIALQNPGGGLGPDWYVEWVMAGYPGNNVKYFYVRQWLESGTSTTWINP